MLQGLIVAPQLLKDALLKLGRLAITVPILASRHLVLFFKVFHFYTEASCLHYLSLAFPIFLALFIVDIYFILTSVILLSQYGWIYSASPRLAIDVSWAMVALGTASCASSAKFALRSLRLDLSVRLKFFFLLDFLFMPRLRMCHMRLNYLINILLGNLDLGLRHLF